MYEIAMIECGEEGARAIDEYIHTYVRVCWRWSGDVSRVVAVID